VYPWLNLVRRGVAVRLSAAPRGYVDLDDLARRVDRQTRVVFISHVQWSSGYRSDLTQLGRFCRDRGILFVVDVIQSLGYMPVDVRALGADVCVAGCYKWLMGIPGAAVFYVRRDVMDRLPPDHAGQCSVKTPMLARPDLAWLDDAMRYTAGAPCAPALIVLQQTLEMLLELGPERSFAHILGLLDHLVAGLHSLGLVVTSSLEPKTRSGILTFTTGDAARDEALQRHLVTRDVIVSYRPTGVRVSPHAYNTREDIDRLLVELGASLRLPAPHAHA
jgi:selenocysteine lyase/cysteine desulfurase